MDIKATSEQQTKVKECSGLLHELKVYVIGDDNISIGGLRTDSHKTKSLSKWFKSLYDTLASECKDAIVYSTCTSGIPRIAAESIDPNKLVVVMLHEDYVRVDSKIKEYREFIEKARKSFHINTPVPTKFEYEEYLTLVAQEVVDEVDMLLVVSDKYRKDRTIDSVIKVFIDKGKEVKRSYTQEC